MKDLFDSLWVEQDVPMVTQEPHELYAVFCLMRGYESFLEIGSCYGTSLYILSHALKPRARVMAVDLCEQKSAKYLHRHIAKLNSKGYAASVLKGNSHTAELDGKFDVVFVDASHDYESVRKDVEKYRPMAKHLLLLHDIRMSGPSRVFDEIGGGLRINCDHRLNVAPETGFGCQWVF